MSIEFRTLKHLFTTGCVTATSTLTTLNAADDNNFNTMIITEQTQDYPVAPIAFSKVSLTDTFWLPRLRIQKNETVPFALEKTQRAVENLRRCGAYLRGEKTELPFPHRFISSDLYKVMEGAAYLLNMQPDPELEAQMDEIIDIIGKAQQDDGYLYVAHSCGVWNKQEMGETPYSWVVHSHELYNVGHLYEGAVAYYEATGKRAWLDIAEKSAQHVNKAFFEGDPNYNGGVPINQAPGHQEPELALCRLYRATGNELYLNMAKKFLDIRGVTYKLDGEGIMSPSYAQQHAPVSEQNTAVGHAVRAAYMYAAMADVSALTGDRSYDHALEKIWENIVDAKMHITGGLGAIHGIEGFGEDYDLPNLEAYNETCAAIANVFFNHRMTLLHKDAKYFDVAEVSLFNNSLAGVNIEGNKFFYVNPLEADGHQLFNHGSAGRSPWFDCACCPSNIARVMNHVGGYMYAVEDDTVYALLYSGNEVTFTIAGAEVTLKQETAYPYEGAVRIETELAIPTQFAVKLRIPTWALGEQFVPGKLYQYTEQSRPIWTLKVNGEVVQAEVVKGFVEINRTWAAGDVIELDLPMDVRFSVCDEKVAANVGRVSVTRGPLVMCAEEADNNGAVQRFYLPQIPSSASCSVDQIKDGILAGTPIVSVPAAELVNGESRSAELKFVPYLSWNNRGNATMIVWLPDAVEGAEAQLSRVHFDPAKYGTITASSCAANGVVDAVKDGRRPDSSTDTTIEAWISSGESEKEWIQMVFDQPQTVERLGLFWVSHDQVDVPASWRMEYLQGGTWHPFEKYITDVYGVSKDRFNTIHPAAELTCEGLRVNIEAQPGKSVGLFDLELTLSTKK
jgi:uncharacterized protein